MTARSWRGARPLAAPLVVALLATACSGSHSTPTAATQPSTTTSAAPASEPAAARLVARATASTRALRSYSFAATETVAANQPVRTHLTGRVVRGKGIAYDLVTGAKHTQVVRTAGATYVRAVPGRWARLTHGRPVADPTATLLAVLGGLRQLARTDVTTVRGVLPESAAKSAGIPTDGRPANVTVALDRSGRVTAVDVTTSTSVGVRNVTVTVVTTYAEFDRAPAVRAPTT